MGEYDGVPEWQVSGVGLPGFVMLARFSRVRVLVVARCLGYSDAPHV